MVQAHQKQIVAWEEDRQRVSATSRDFIFALVAVMLQYKYIVSARHGDLVFYYSLFLRRFLSLGQHLKYSHIHM